MNILITGNEGFIGKHLTKYLTDKGHNIKGWDLKSGLDVDDITEDDLKDIDCVIHLAASTSVWNEKNEEIIHNNIKCFVHILDLCKYMKIKLLYASSSCSCNITSLYGLSKQFDENYSKLSEWGVGMRFHNVYGPNSREDTLMGICMQNDKIVLYNNGNNTRHFTYIDDICWGVNMCIHYPTGVYNLYNPEENTTLEFVKEVSKYKDIDIVLTKEIRDKDKESQLVEDNYINLLETNYTPIEYGIESCYHSNCKERESLYQRMG